MKPSYAPIAFFVYNRPDHARRTLKSLQQCQEFAKSPLLVFSDGAKSDNDVEAVKQVRRVVQGLCGENAEIVAADRNQGLADSVINGVTTVCREYGCAIVVEDDLLVSPYFLRYMNDGLRRYQQEETVMQISGHMFPVGTYRDRRQALFLPMISSWGWATWQRAWQLFDSKAKGWEEMATDKDLRNRFNIDGAFNFYRMLERQMKGIGSSWAIRWYWSVFNHGGLALFPPRAMVENIGFDGSGTHGWRRSKNAFCNPDMMQAGCTFPERITVIPHDFVTVRRALRHIDRGGPTLWLSLLVDKIGLTGKGR